jgi:single-strand DNA-binding protein
MSLNLVTLVGRAGYGSGSALLRVGQGGEDKPDWFNLELWGRTAEVAGEYVRKGSLVGVTGSLKFERWKDRSTGEERQRPVIAVERLELLGSRQDREPDLPVEEPF